MKRASRVGNMSMALLIAMRGWQSGLWTALPVTVVSYDPATQTVEAQVVMSMVFSDGNQVRSNLVIPPLLDVPIQFPGGGGYTLSFPLAKGDEGLVVFSSRCIDGWWATGQTGNPPHELRMHDLSDAIFIPRLRNKIAAQNMSPALSATNAQLRSDDGTAVIELAASGGNHNINITTNGVTTVKAPTINLQNAGSSLKKLVKDTFITLFNNHIHTNGNGGANTGVPVTASTTDTTTVVSAE